MSHLKSRSIRVKRGQKIRRRDMVQGVDALFLEYGLVALSATERH